MSLKYSLEPNLLTANTDDYKARTKQTEVVNVKGLIKIILKGRPPLSEVGITSAFELQKKAIKEILLSGKSVDLGFIKIEPSIVGIFNSQEDIVDGKTREVKLNSHVTKELKEITKDIKTEKIDAIQIAPNITNVKDYTSGKQNSHITPNAMIKIQGSMLKVEGTNADVGVFFIANDNKEHKVTIIGENKPSTLLVKVPTLAKGNYYLEIRTQYTKSRNVKDTRIGAFNTTLTVL